MIIRSIPMGNDNKPMLEFPSDNCPSLFEEDKDKKTYHVGLSSDDATYINKQLSKITKSTYRDIAYLSGLRRGNINMEIFHRLRRYISQYKTSNFAKVFAFNNSDSIILDQFYGKRTFPDVVLTMCLGVEYNDELISRVDKVLKNKKMSALICTKSDGNGIRIEGYNNILKVEIRAKREFKEHSYYYIII